MRFGTWNVEYATGERKNADRLACLRDIDADVWILTETRDTLNLPPPYTASSTVSRYRTLADGPSDARWTTIWSRFPAVRRLRTTDDARTVAVELRAPRGNVIVYGTVLPWLADPGPIAERPVRGWTEMDRVLPVQLAEWRSILTENPGVPLVVAGDFNVSLDGSRYYGTKRHKTALLGGFRELGLRCPTAVTPRGSPHPPIDHVVVPETWSVVDVRGWGGAGLSDHSGVVVDVRPGG